MEQQIALLQELKSINTNTIRHIFAENYKISFAILENFTECRRCCPRFRVHIVLSESRRHM